MTKLIKDLQDAYDICEESGEVPDEWFEEEVAALRILIDENYRGA